MSVFESFKVPFARERVSVTTASAKSLTADTYNDHATGVDARRPATACRITVEDADIRFSETSGTTPNATSGSSGVGSIARQDDIIYLSNQAAIANFKAIGISATAQLEVVYYR